MCFCGEINKTKALPLKVANTILMKPKLYPHFFTKKCGAFADSPKQTLKIQQNHTITKIFKNCTYANVNKNASIKRNNYGKS